VTDARVVDGASSVGWKLGALLQLVAGAIVFTVLLAALEFACGFFVGKGDLLGSLKRAEGDTVATTLKVLELAPEINPSPLVTDFDLLWRNKPLAHKTQPVNPRPYGRDDAWTIEIDSRGFRGRERPLPRQHDGTYRILCVGDSITFGFSVDQEAPFARRLEELLRTRYPSRPIEVVNAGVPGWSWVQGRRFLERDGLALRPGDRRARHQRPVLRRRRAPPRCGETRQSVACGKAR